MIARIVVVKITPGDSYLHTVSNLLKDGTDCVIVCHPDPSVETRHTIYFHERLYSKLGGIYLVPKLEAKLGVMGVRYVGPEIVYIVPHVGAYACDNYPCVVVKYMSETDPKITEDALSSMVLGL